MPDEVVENRQLHGDRRGQPVREAGAREQGDGGNLHREPRDAHADEGRPAPGPRARHQRATDRETPASGAGSGSSAASARAFLMAERKNTSPIPARATLPPTSKRRDDTEAERRHHRLHQHHQRANRQHDAQLGRAEPAERDAEDAERVRGEERLGAERADRRRAAPRRATGSSARQRHPAEQHRRVDDVDDVVDVEAVARALAVADARQRAVEAVAEPVDRQQQPGRAAGPARRRTLPRRPPRRQPSRARRAP